MRVCVKGFCALDMYFFVVFKTDTDCLNSSLV